MKTMLYTFFGLDGIPAFVLSLFALLIVVSLVYFFTRWLFSIKRQLWQQKQQLNVLLMIAEKLGVPRSELEDIIIMKDKNDEHLK